MSLVFLWQPEMKQNEGEHRVSCTEKATEQPPQNIQRRTRWRPHISESESQVEMPKKEI